MRVKIAQIGNSKGIRIPKPILEECGIVDEAEMETNNGIITISAVPDVRVGWQEAAVRNKEGLEADWEW
jgi:antitoxin MazE